MTIFEIFSKFSVVEFAKYIEVLEEENDALKAKMFILEEELD